jgi:RHS repeat-associated protein
MLVTSQELDLGMFHGVEGKIQHHEYSSFGVLQSVTDENGDDISANPKLDPYFTYTGREFDKETGLYYYRARYYDANTGRFLQVDPDAGTMISPITHINKYSYVGNNPINMIDPSGLRGLLSVCVTSHHPDTTFSLSFPT